MIPDEFRDDFCVPHVECIGKVLFSSLNRRICSLAMFFDPRRVYKSKHSGLKTIRYSVSKIS